MARRLQSIQLLRRKSSLKGGNFFESVGQDPNFQVRVPPKTSFFLPAERVPYSGSN
mgnify:CR=1 FL=1